MISHKGRSGGKAKRVKNRPLGRCDNKRPREKSSQGLHKSQTLEAKNQSNADDTVKSLLKKKKFVQMLRVAASSGEESVRVRGYPMEFSRILSLKRGWKNWAGGTKECKGNGSGVKKRDDQIGEVTKRNIYRKGRKH